MTFETPSSTPEHRETLADNARKFVAAGVDPEFIEAQSATSFTLITDWLETNEDNEKKLAYKKFENGDVQILLISKITVDGNRTSEKEKITEERYEELLASSVLRLEKKRYEFSYDQEGTSFDIKYDEFANSDLRVLEADAKTDEERVAFNPATFPAELQEVTGDIRYYGYRVAGVI